MRSRLVLALCVCVSVLALSVFLVAALEGGEGSAAKGETGATGSGAKAEGGEKEAEASEMTPEKMWSHCMARMHEEGVPAPMQMRCKMFMGSRLSKTDPSALLALREELALTGAQITKLEAIAARSAAEAAVVLSGEQKEKLAAVPEKPDTMMGMERHMMPHMKKMMEKDPGMKGKMTCPMCPMMRHMKGGEGSGTKMEGSSSKDTSESGAKMEGSETKGSDTKGSDTK